jgi:hypothetical protein
MERPDLILDKEVLTIVRFHKRSFAHSRFDSKILRFRYILLELFPLRRTKWFLFLCHATATERTENLNIFLKEIF